MRVINRNVQYENKKSRWIGLLLLTAILLFTGHPGHAIEISDSPMATQIQKAPPNIMFVIDNSGSMSWEVMIAGTGQGLWYSERFNRNFASVFDTRIGPEWPSQWSDVNKIFYNPKVTYKPWPHPDSNIDRMPQANTLRPYQNPYHYLDPSHYNQKTDIRNLHYFLPQPMQDDIVVIDNLDKTGFTSSRHWVPPWHRHKGYWETDWEEYWANPKWKASAIRTRREGAWAAFTPTIPIEGDYDIYVWWPCSGTNHLDDKAKITVDYYNTTTNSPDSKPFIKNQRRRHGAGCGTGGCGEWLPIGTYYFLAGTLAGNTPDGRGRVTISRHSGSGGSYTMADAVLFAPHGTTLPSMDDSIDISYAHYVAVSWDDANNDGLVQNEEVEDAYLVNFQGRNRCGSLANADQSRQVYHITDVNEDGVLEDASDLTYYGTELPESLRPPVYDEDGKPTGSYMTGEQELQNFANWFTYYRTRELSGKAAIGSVIDDTQGIQVGFYSLHDRNNGISRQPVLPVKIPGKTDETSTLLTHLYKMSSGGGTPLRDSLRAVGRYFDQTDGSATFKDTDGKNVSLGASPYYPENQGGACQHAFAIVMTDGYWNHWRFGTSNDNTDPTVGNADENEGEPYADLFSDTLADTAMYFYKRDLSSTLPNQLPPTNCDNTTQPMHQHMVTFSVSFGLNGSINMDDMNDNQIPDVEEDFNHDGKADGLSYKTDPCFKDDNTPMPKVHNVQNSGWPKPRANQPSTIDDLWHAAINGRGEFFSASNPEELVKALVAIFEKVKKVVASEAAFTIDGDVISSNPSDPQPKVFGPSYDSATWTGDVKAMALDADGNFKYDNNQKLIVEWRASEKLWDLVKGPSGQGENHVNRKIITMHDGGNGIPFRWADLSTHQKSLLKDNSDILEYIRGRINIGGFRIRQNNDLETTNILGDIVHSSPVISPSGGTVFVGANDGMLHAFDAETGDERFAYIPNLVFKNLSGLKETSFQHKFFVDATPAIWPNVNGKILLVGGLGKGGKGYYALDITNAENYASTAESSIASSLIKWEYPSPGHTDDDMGYSFSKPFIVKSNYKNGEWVVIFGNGYNSANGHAVLYVLDADTGIELARFDTGDMGGDNGLSTPSLVDLNNDYKVDVVYAGDLKGNLWKFDLSGSSTGDWNVDFGGNALFKAVGPNNTIQPITTKPAVMRHPLRHGLMVLFGTGKFLGEIDRINTDVQTLYGIWDFSDSDDSEYLGQFNHASKEVGHLSNIQLLQQNAIYMDDFDSNDESLVDTYGEDGNGSKSVHFLRLTSDHTANWAVDNDTPLPNPDSAATEQAHAGWYFDLSIPGDPFSIPGERLLESPLIREGVFIAVTTIPDSSYCSGGGWSIINEFDATDGSRPAKPTFDVTGKESDGKILINESDKVNITARVPSEIGDNGETIWAPATSILKPGGGILHLSESSIVELPGAAPKLEKKILSSSIGKTQEIVELAPRRGIAFWREH